MLGRDADGGEPAHRHPAPAEKLAELTDTRAGDGFALHEGDEHALERPASGETLEARGVPAEGAAQHRPRRAQLLFVDGRTNLRCHGRKLGGKVVGLGGSGIHWIPIVLRLALSGCLGRPGPIRF